MKIIVIGELCIDEFIYGSVNRLCPEAPVPVFNPSYTTTNKGMAGNVVNNLLSMAPNAEITFWHQSDIIQKTRIIDDKSNQMIVRIDKENPIKEEDSFAFAFEKEKIEAIKDSDIIIISDYNKGFLSNEAIKKIGFLAKNKLTVLDTKRKLDVDIAKLFSYIKLNKDEAELNKEISNFSNVIVTLGKDGARIGNKFFKQEKPQETIDVSGAGDTFTAAFALSYYDNKDVSLAIKIANDLAGIVVGKRGVATPFK